MDSYRVFVVKGARGVVEVVNFSRVRLPSLRLLFFPLWSEVWQAPRTRKTKYDE
jgi:hypothetical protein